MKKNTSDSWGDSTIMNPNTFPEKMKKMEPQRSKKESKWYTKSFRELNKFQKDESGTGASSRLC